MCTNKLCFHGGMRKMLIRYRYPFIWSDDMKTMKAKIYHSVQSCSLYSD